MKTWYLLAAILVSGFTCGKPGDTYHSIVIRNDADHPVSFYVAALGMEHMYPDTQLESGKPAMRTIQPDNSATWRISLSFDQLFEQLPTDTLSVYLFHPDTLNKYEWPVVRSDYKVLRRYDLSPEDLKNRNYIITYP